MIKYIKKHIQNMGLTKVFNDLSELIKRPRELILIELVIFLIIFVIYVLVWVIIFQFGFKQPDALLGIESYRLGETDILTYGLYITYALLNLFVIIWAGTKIKSFKESNMFNKKILKIFDIIQYIFAFIFGAFIGIIIYWHVIKNLDSKKDQKEDEKNWEENAKKAEDELFKELKITNKKIKKSSPK
jgi:hypothetical protein